MKKLLLLFLLAGFTANAQEREKNNIEITPKIAYSSFAYSQTSNTGQPISSGSIGSVNFGVTGDYYFTDRWSLHSGLLYQPMGATNIMYSTSQPTNGEEKLNYLNIPINANYHFGSTRKWNLNFGFAPSFLLSATATYPGIGVNDEDISSMANSFQLGLTYGIGYKIEVSDKFGILMDMQGFSGLTKADIGDAGIQNYGYNFNLGGVFLL